MEPAVLIGAGGTGGHIFPGLAVAGAIRRRSPGARLSFMGTRRGLERTIIPERGYRLHLVSMRPFSRRLGAEPLLALFSLVRSTLQARRVLRREGIDVVVGMGGYAGLPAVAAARLTGTPCLVHESGAVPGLANKLAARLTRNVAVAFETAAAHLPHSRVVGMPLDPALASVDRAGLRAEGRGAFGLGTEGAVVLVVGGSLGARRLNELGVALAERWRERGDVQILLKAGREHLEKAEEELARRGLSGTARAAGFIERMDLAYAASDLAVCRAGAGTVAELAAAGLPAILVPYPHAPEDHQTRNATPLVRAGAALVVPDGEALAGRVGPLIEEVLWDAARLRRMGEAARALARPNAADDLAAWALELAGRGSEGGV